MASAVDAPVVFFASLVCHTYWILHRWTLCLSILTLADSAPNADRNGQITARRFQSITRRAAAAAVIGIKIDCKIFRGVARVRYVFVQSFSVFVYRVRSARWAGAAPYMHFVRQKLQFYCEFLGFRGKTCIFGANTGRLPAIVPPKCCEVNQFSIRSYAAEI